MLTKTKNKSSVEESINPENGLIFFGDGVKKTRQLTVKKAELTVEEPELTVNEPELTVKEKIKLIREHLKNKCGFIPSNQWINGHLDDFTCEDEQVIEKLPEETITLDETVKQVLDATFKIIPLDDLLNEDPVILEGDFEITNLWLMLKNSFDKLIDLRTKVTPILEKTLHDLQEFDLYCHIQNTQEFLANQLGLETEVRNPKSNYEQILDYEYLYCDLTDLSPINEYFRAYWLFMWFEKRASIPTPSIVFGDIPKDKILKYLDTRFSIKHLKEGSTKRDYFYQLYLQVKPYLVHYFQIEKYEQEELFTYEI